MLQYLERPSRIDFSGIQFPWRIQDQRLRHNRLHNLLGKSVGVFELAWTDSRKNPFGTFRILRYERRLSAHGQGDLLTRKHLLHALGNLGLIAFSYQTDFKVRIELTVMLAEVRSLDWRNVGHLCADGGRNETMIAKGTVCRIDSNPASSRQKNLNPCMEVALSPPILNVNMKVAEETAHHADPQTDFPENRGAKQCGIPTG